MKKLIMQAQRLDDFFENNGYFQLFFGVSSIIILWAMGWFIYIMTH
jgi:hypothetical protein